MTPKSGLLLASVRRSRQWVQFLNSLWRTDLGSLATLLFWRLAFHWGFLFFAAVRENANNHSHVFEPTPLAVTKRRRWLQRHISTHERKRPSEGFLRQLLHTGVAAPQLAHRYSLSTTQS